VQFVEGQDLGLAPTPAESIEAFDHRAVELAVSRELVERADDEDRAGPTDLHAAGREAVLVAQLQLGPRSCSAHYAYD
jgi:hypothetical protein